MSAIGDEPHLDKRVCIYIPADPTAPIKVVGHKDEVEVFVLAVDMKARKRELLTAHDIPLPLKDEMETTWDLNFNVYH